MNDDMAYLNQITQSTQKKAPSANTGGGLGVLKTIFTPTVIKILVGAIVLVILMVIGGNVMSSIREKPIELTKQLELRMEGLNEVLTTEGKSLKSTKIISANASLKVVLLDNSQKLATWLLDTQGYDTGEPSEELEASETAAMEELTSTLEDARLNGVLDRTYVREVQLQLSLMMSTESEIMERTSSEELKEILTNSYSSLETINNSLDNLAAE